MRMWPGAWWTEAGGIRRCAEWIDHLERESFPPVVNLRPESDFPDRHAVVVDLPRVAAVLRRIAFGVDELVHARSVQDLDGARVCEGPRAARRRRLAEPDLGFAEFCTRTGTPSQSIHQGTDVWTAYQAEHHHRGEADESSYTEYNPYRHGRT
ncbi:hypothetical protein ACFTXM_34280 [Streptomyces sp. NPDC056930]|uniref:hypothetical protein n=1 Tax=Streptomyces sp. NPDC056930 TaxID=3345967 RepID=UPI0036321794